MPSPKPSVIVRREFEATPDVVEQQLRACIVGPSCQLVRYKNSAEKAKGLVATAVSADAVTDGQGGALKRLLTADTSYTIPNLASTSVLDLPYTKVFVEDALLTYAHFADVSTFFVFTTGSNSISLQSGAWKGNSRNGSLVQDVAVGDTIQFYALGVLKHTSVVTGFTAATGSAALGNIGTSLAASTAVGGAVVGSATAGNVTLTLSTASYLAGTTLATYQSDPRTVGKTKTNYTLTITASTPTTVDYSVVSDTGIDNALAAGKTSGSGQLITLPSGATVYLTFTSQPVVGTVLNFNTVPEHTKPTIASSGSPTYTINGASLTSATPATTYIVTCTRGGTTNATAAGLIFAPQFTVTTNNGADTSTSIQTTGTTADIPIGSFGLKIVPTANASTSANGFVKGDTFTVAVSAAAAGAISTVVFADAQPTTVSAAATNFVRLSKKKTVQLPLTEVSENWSITDPADADLRKLKLKTIVTVKDSSINSGLTASYVTAGKVYIQYRAFQSISREVGSVTTLSDITTQLGTIDADNLLAYGVYKAWSNANGATVHYIPTVNQTLNGYRGFADALSLAKGNRNCYGLVPLSTSAEVWNAFVGHAKDESAATVGRFRVVWIAPEVPTHNQILDVDISGSAISFTAAGSATVANVSWQIDTAQNTKFTESVQAGDFIRVVTAVDNLGNSVYTEYKINAVIDNNSLLISWTETTGPALSSTVGTIYRDLTSNALALKYAATAGGFSSERVFAVVPDRGINGLRVDGVPVSNWYIACAFAGLRSGSRPQQPLSNVELLGFDGVNVSTAVFDEVDLDVLRDGGVWAVRNAAAGTVYVERQLSTSTIDLYRKEQSVTCNVDSISFTLADVLRGIVGRVNITESNKALVSALLTATLMELTATNGATTIGPQLNAFTLVSITVPATAKDTLLVKVQITVPLPMNTIDITLVI